MKPTPPFRGLRTKRLFILGLDCAAPDLVFSRWRSDLPNLTRLAEHGLSGELQSCIPAITVPAWSCMLSGRDPGELGIYGFRNRADYSYENRFIADSSYVKVDRIWDYLTRDRKRSVIIGVPQTYPVRPLRGQLIADFLTPGIDHEFTYPDELKAEILEIAPDYDVDVPQFRTEHKEHLLDQIWQMTKKRFAVVDHMLGKRWDLFMLMEIGVDRIHHGFWSFHDPQHRRYEAGNPYENAIHDYYVFIDQKLGEWLERIGEDTAVLVVSDHGAKRMEGGICINEWLWRQGLLRFQEDPKDGTVTPFSKLTVDWSRTRAWGDGGYYGRIFVNVAGREPKGVVPQREYETFRDDLAESIRAIPGPAGEDLSSQVFKPEQIYRAVNGAAPDLMVYFGDLLWRSVGSLGHGGVHTYANDTGPDVCNHAQNGMFILYHPEAQFNGARLKAAQLFDITPTVLEMFSIRRPPSVQGRSLMQQFEEGRGLE